jgi:ZIP family zinc transporter
MVAASVWSLLIPAMELSADRGSIPPTAVAVLGAMAGTIFLWGVDKLQDKLISKGTALQSHQMLMLSITLHNLPEGLAVGVAFGAIPGSPDEKAAFAAAVSVALGISIQNFPEGAAVSLPLRRAGCSKARSFFLGQSSALVEPLGGVLGALLVSAVRAALPWSLAFAAGCMLLVCFKELFPALSDGGSADYFPAVAGIVGFLLMMGLDRLTF